ncbi:MAG: 4-hydroxy-3-methylbut-2-enyl diphosphate reductase [Caldisericia bacterium]|jgi:4-hydroxy-3-methylbut-2-enyl diphosphate reductase|nr:4-hydroxy-3-methylbut-2-enyl diphosphate reductase [Caldisericia bacterium]
MEIIESKFLGFCSGVKRAYELVKKELNRRGKVYINKELVHNKDVNMELEREGLIVVRDLNEIPEKSTFIIPAHGLSFEEYMFANKKNLNIVDATCPLVIKSLIIGKKILQKGQFLFIIGEKNHQEIIFLYSNLKSEKTFVIDENDNIPHINGVVGVIVQTTQSEEFYKKMKNKISEKIKNVVFYDTICKESKKRQIEVEEVAKKVDLLLVIGGKNSSNTKRLYEIGKKFVKTYHIENEDEIENDWFINIKKVGIVSGTSTPDFVIERIKEKCLKLQ